MNKTTVKEGETRADAAGMLRELADKLERQSDGHCLVIIGVIGGDVVSVASLDSKAKEEVFSDRFADRVRIDVTKNLSEAVYNAMSGFKMNGNEDDPAIGTNHEVHSTIVKSFDGKHPFGDDDG